MGGDITQMGDILLIFKKVLKKFTVTYQVEHQYLPTVHHVVFSHISEAI